MPLGARPLLRLRARLRVCVCGGVVHVSGCKFVFFFAGLYVFVTVAIIFRKCDLNPYIRFKGDR